MTPQLLFYLSVGVLVYAYLAYPLIIMVWARLRPRPVATADELRPVSVVIAARNEEHAISKRIENLLEQEYPEDLIEVIVVSDGSTDRTAEVARCHAGQRVRIIECPKPAGKAVALNLGVAAARHEIVVFADARQRFAPDALRALVAPFHDQDVGAVTGELILLERNQAVQEKHAIGFYWRYEKLIRVSESAVASVVGVTGAIYAVRRELFRPLEPHTVLDDLLVPMYIVLGGHRVVFTRNARAYDFVSSDLKKEFKRKVRTLAGNYQAMRLFPRLFNPLKNPLFVQFLSHKLARLIAPFCCVVAVVTSATVPSTFFRIAFGLQLAFYCLAVLSFTPLKCTKLGVLFRIPATFTVLNLAALFGLWVYLTRHESQIWK